MQNRDSLLVHGVRYIEVQRGYGSTIESEMIVTLMTLPVILLSGQLAKQFFHAGKSELASCLSNCQGGMHCNNLASGPSEHKTSFHRE